MVQVLIGIVASLIAAFLITCFALCVRKASSISCLAFTRFEDRPIQPGMRTEFSLRGRKSEYITIEVSGQPPMYISGGNIERKEGSKHEIPVDRSARRLVIAGWGCSHSRSRIFHGCILDSAEIGRIEYRNKKNEKTYGEIRLPSYRCQHQKATITLKLASGNPLFSGDPDNKAVRSCGLLGRVKVHYNKEARQFWPFANVWLDEIWLPQGTRFVNLCADPGSFSLVHVRVVHRPWVIEKLLRRFPGQISGPSESEDFSRFAHPELASAASIEQDLRDQSYKPTLQLTKMGVHLVNAAYYLRGRDRTHKLRQAAEAFFEAAKNIEQSVPRKSCEYSIQGFLCLLQSGSDEVFEVVEDVNSKIMDVADKYTRQGKVKAPFSLQPRFLKLRHHVGWFYLECAQAATLVTERNKWWEKAYMDFLEMYESIIQYGQMLSEPLLRFLEERCLILERVHDELEISRPETAEPLVRIRQVINNLLTEILGDEGQI